MSTPPDFPDADNETQEPRNIVETLNTIAKFFWNIAKAILYFGIAWFGWEIYKAYYL